MYLHDLVGTYISGHGQIIRNDAWHDDKGVTTLTNDAHKEHLV